MSCYVAVVEDGKFIFHAIHETSHGYMVYKARHSRLEFQAALSKKLLSITERSLMLLSTTKTKIC